MARVIVAEPGRQVPVDLTNSHHLPPTTRDRMRRSIAIWEVLGIAEEAYLRSLREAPVS